MRYNGQHCRDCHRVPEPGEQHGLLDGLTDEGEPLGFTCLDADGDVIYEPRPCTTCGATGPCGCPAPF